MNPEKTAQKIDFLMNLTNTKNKTLANAVNLDASYISRLRSGKRNLADKKTLITIAASFFVPKIKTENQKKLLCTTMGIDEFPNDEQSALTLILNWLSTHKELPNNAMANMLNMFMMPPKQLSKPQKTKDVSDNKELYYFGVEGKQKAVARFLTNVNKSKKPQTLLLFSDENMSWMFENPEFSKQWTALLSETLMNGNKIKIIHSIGRDLNELFEAVTKWVPIYATGRIEPYYYPRVKDGIFQHTFFIAPETGEAIVSSSVKQNVDDMLHFYVTDKKAVESLVKEYQNYFELCKPLMQIGNIHNAEKVKTLFKNFNEKLSKTIVIRPFLPVATMPKKMAEVFSKEHNCEILTKMQKSGLKFIKMNQDTTEIITNINTKNDKILFPYSLCVGSKEIEYSKQDYINHLQNTKKIAEKYNYRFIMQDNNFLNNMIIYYKEDFGVMLFKLDFPCTTFLIQEANIVSAFGEYLNNQVEKLTKLQKY